VVGFKPTNGAVADPIGFPSIAPGIDTLCPIGATVDDTRRLFEAIVGSDARDPLSINLPSAPLREPATLRVAYSPLLGLDAAIDADVASAVDAAVEHLIDQGLNVIKSDPVWPGTRQEAMISAIEFAGLASRYGEAWKRDPSLFDPHVGNQIAIGLGLSGVDVVRARDVSFAVWRAMGSFFKDFDLLIGPTLACVSWSVDRIYPTHIGGVPAEPRGHAVFTPLFNHAQTPAITVPCGAGRDALPVGLQIVGPQFADRQVLMAAHWIETALGSAAHPWRAAPWPFN
jgi:aspartyl-tRNA(Asn)/glutamyl-tRNA(Gln) amidotransferase subunit A